MYEHENTANLQQIDVTVGFQQSLHAANANSQRTVFTINMPPSFLLWRIVYISGIRLRVSQTIKLKCDVVYLPDIYFIITYGQNNLKQVCLDGLHPKST